MGGLHIHHLLFFFLLRSSLSVADDLYCHVGKLRTMETYPVTWLTEKVDICDANHFLCQETLIMIKSGSRIAILATKGCVSEGSKSVTYIQNSEFPGLIVISYSKYCDTSLCNNIKDLSQIWKPREEIPVSNMSTSVHCPTCVALGSCFNVTSLPCPRGINGCYAGRIMFSGEGIDTLVEVKGCSSMTHCELMNGFSMIGTLSISEVCPHPSLVQRSTESGAPWLCLPVRGLQLLTPLLGLLAHLL